MQGKTKILEYFYLLKKQNAFKTSYLFVGNDFACVKDIIKSVNCRCANDFCGQCWDCRMIEEEKHPDLFVIVPEPTTIKIERIREAQAFLSLKPFSLVKKTILIKEGEQLSLEAANAFLKTLEEPPAHAFIALCALHLQGLLPTVISRCQKVFLPFQEQTVPSGIMTLAGNFLKGEEVVFKNRNDFSRFLWALIVIFRDHLVALVSGNNRLRNNSACEIILKPYTKKQTEDIVEDMLRIYGAYKNINENLALSLIRMKL